MPTVELDKKRVLWQLGRKLDDEELADRIAMMGTSVEGITDKTITVEAFPNRPDFLSEEGISRSLAGFIGAKKGLEKYAVKKGDYSATIEAPVKAVREHAVAAVVKNVSIDADFLRSLMQVQEKLHATHSRKRKMAAIGIHKLDVIKFPIRYTAVDQDFRFVPLDSNKEMTIREILQKHPKGIEFAHLVKDKAPIWLDASNEVIAFPPIINAARTAVTPGTKNLFVDVTGLDRKVVQQALNMVVTILADHGGEIYSVSFGKEATPDLSPSKMALDEGYVNKVLGLSLTKKEIISFLQKMRFGAEDGGGKKISVLIPAYRTDVLHPVDLVEDIAIAYGYENFEHELPATATIGEESHVAQLVRKLCEAAAGLGFLECNTYHLTSKDVLFRKMGLPEAPAVAAVNAVNANYDTLRNSLLPGLMKIFSENKHHEYPQKLFDAGHAILPDAKAENRCREELRLAIASSHASASLTEIRGVVEAILGMFGKECSFRPTAHPSFMKGRAAEVVVGGKAIGIVGEISPAVLENFGLENPVAAAEILIEPNQYC
jgi:phenylalanyl-tRNA synthetase beta chain